MKDTDSPSAKKSPEYSKMRQKDSGLKGTPGLSKMGTQDFALEDDCGGSFATKMFAKLKTGTK
jgi:hypothetical protein